MNQKTVLTPMQLFFCAKLMDAVYYDYAYLAAMPDVQKEYALHEQETMEELEDQGMIERDFDDNVEMAEDLCELLTPVFWEKRRKTGCGRKAVLQVPQQGWSDYDDCAGKWKDYDFRIVRG